MSQNIFKSKRAMLGWCAAALVILLAAGIVVIVFSNGATANKKADSAGSTASTAKNGEVAEARGAAGSLKKELPLAEWKTRIERTGSKGFATLMRQVMGIQDHSLRSEVATLLVAKWVSEDLTGFIAFVDATEVDDDGGGAASALWEVLAPALANALPTLSDETASRSALGEVVRRLIEYAAQKDPVQAFAWAKDWLLDDARESALATIAGEMIKLSPRQALEVLGEIHAPVRRVDAISAIAAVYGTSHPVEATAWAKALPVAVERPYAMNAVLAARSEVEPEASAKEFADFRQTMQTAYAAEREAEIARMGMKDIPKASGEPLTAEEAMDFEVLPSKEDPQAGLLSEAAVAIATNWAAADPAQAMEWSESLPDGSLKNDVMQSALTGWATRQPQAAYEYYMKNLSTQPDVAVPIFEAWAESEPAHAAEHAALVVNPGLREKAVSGVVSGWLSSASDSAELTAWVDKLPRQQERDLANSQIAEATSYDDPDTAWQRATSIQDRRTRKEALKSAFASMVESDPNSARIALAGAANLTADETKRLTRMLNAVSAGSTN
jgi:hypothetical protein